MGETELSLDNFYFFEVLTLLQSAQKSNLSSLFGDFVPKLKNFMRLSHLNGRFLDCVEMKTKI